MSRMDQMLDALAGPAGGGGVAAHAVDTRRQRVAKVLLGAALEEDTGRVRYLAEGLLEPERTQREEARERVQGRADEAARRCAGAESASQAVQALVAALENALGPVEQRETEAGKGWPVTSEGWQSAGRAVAAAMEAPRERQATNRAVDGLAQVLEHAGCGRDGIRESERALRWAMEATQPVTSTQRSQQSAWQRLRTAMGDVVAGYCAHAAGRPERQRQAARALSPALAEGLDVARRQRDGWREDLLRRAREAGGEGAGICVVMTANYPFDPEKPIFNRTRGDRPGGNPATREMVASHPCVIPVGMDREGRACGHGASAALYAEMGKQDPEGVLARTVVAVWDEEKGEARFKPIRSHANGRSQAGRWRECMLQGKHPEGPVPVAEGSGMEPESYDGPAAEPGQPLWVVVNEGDRVEGREEESEVQGMAPYHVGDRGQGSGVHPQALAITVAARLGGSRPVALLTGETSQGLLFSRSPLRGPDGPQRNEDGTVAEAEPLISIPVHRAVANLAAGGGQGLAIEWLPGAPARPAEPLAGQGGSLFVVSGGDREDKALYSRKEERATPLGEWRVWTETAAKRGAWTPEQDALKARSLAGKERTTIGLLCGGETVPGIIATVAAGYRKDVLFVVPEEVWSQEGVAEKARKALRDAYPRGTANILPGGRTSHRGDTRGLPQAGLRGGDAADLAAGACDVVLAEGLDGARDGDRTLLDVAAEAAREAGALPPVVALEGGALVTGAGRSMVWGTRDARKRAGLVGKAQEPGSTTADRTAARLLMARTDGSGGMNAIEVAEAAPVCGGGKGSEVRLGTLIEGALQGKGGVVKAVPRQDPDRALLGLTLDRGDLGQAPKTPVVDIRSARGRRPGGRAGAGDGLSA